MHRGIVGRIIQNCLTSSTNFSYVLKGLSSLKRFRCLQSLLYLRMIIVITQECVTALFKRVNMWKAAGLDAISGCTLHHFAAQFSVVFATLFHMCAELGQIPTFWKTSTVIPIPKSPNSKRTKQV